MSSTLSLIQAVSFAEVARGMLYLSVLSGLILFFRPLLKGFARALVLTVRPRKTNAEQAARLHLQNARAQSAALSARG
jgi:hypothetical protein